MAYPRLKHEEGTAGFYHCVSRCVGGAYLLGEEEKEYLRRGIWKAAQFCGLQVVTYCVMSNHFHILVQVPEKSAQPLSDRELVERIAALHGRGQARLVEKLLADDREHGADASAEELRQRYLRRMGDLSVFMQEIKQRFSRWYNRRHESFGTVWAERFKSLLVEASSPCLTAVAAYIDLNPVRAGLADDPKDYRWCGYAEALAGEKKARQGLAMAIAPEAERARRTKNGGNERGVGAEDAREGRVSGEAGLAARMPASAHWGHVGVVYRKLMMAERPPVPGRSGSGDLSEKRRGEVQAEQARKVIVDGGKLPLPELLRLRVRYFSDGLLLGSKEYAEQMFGRNRSLFGSKRKSGARSVRGFLGSDGGPFYVLRDLKVRVFG